MGDPSKQTFLFIPNQIKLSIVHNQGEKLIATDMGGSFYLVEGFGFYDRRRRFC